MKCKLYKLGDQIFNLKFKGLKAINSGVFRAPKKGEWYLSGAIPCAYQSPNDLSTKYWIAQLVRVKTVTKEIIVEVIK